MKFAKVLLIGILFTGCALTDDGIIFNPPGPQLNICLNEVTDAEAEEMKSKIKSESFPDERMDRARFLAKDRCFYARHVVTVMEGFTFNDNKLEIAKFLYNQTRDQQNYDIVVASLTFKSDRDELRDYIDSMS